MTVIGGILLFVAGFVIGAGLIILHNYEVRKAVNAVRAQKNTEYAKLRREYKRMQEEADIMQQASDCADAYRKGRTDGRAHPMSGAERFARTFEGKNARFVDTTRRERI